MISRTAAVDQKEYFKQQKLTQIKFTQAVIRPADSDSGAPIKFKVNHYI